MFLKSEKNISNRNFFPEIVVEEFIISEKLLQILIKLLNPQILFCKSLTHLQIQELSLNPEKYFTCASSLLPSAVCHIQNSGVTCLVFDSCGSGHS